eukprot:6492935-Karenia_brevis.AAC.1
MEQYHQELDQRIRDLLTDLDLQRQSHVVCQAYADLEKLIVETASLCTKVEERLGRSAKMSEATKALIEQRRHLN